MNTITKREVISSCGIAFRRLTIPDHRELAKGTLRSLIRAAGLTVDEFLALL
jgi:hypothetical protein